MQGYYYNVYANRAQESTITDLLSRYIVRAALINPSIILTLTTKIGSAVKITIDDNGVIQGVEFKQYEE